VVVPLSAPTGRIIITIVANPATVVATADGSAPTVPVGTTTNNTAGAVIIPGVLGQQGILQPPLFGDHMQVPTVNLASTGTPTVIIAW
jgi:hypothetical protein